MLRKTICFYLLCTFSLFAQNSADFWAADSIPIQGDPGVRTKHADRGALLPDSVGGVLAHVAAGGPWRTLIFLTNPGTSDPAKAKLRFYTSNGTSMTVTLTDSRKTVTNSAFEISLPARQSLFLETTNLPPLTQVGFADLDIEFGKMTGYAIFRAVIGNAPNLEAVVPLEWGVSKDSIIAFDNTQGFVTSIAVANRWLYTPCELVADIYDEMGVWLASYRKYLPGQSHTAFETTREWPATAGRRGTVRLSRVGTSCNYAALALLFNPTGSVTSAPVIDIR
ncbi:MAG: hypothetical protein KatS3mg005_3493 [Bryobacteraceae bacterium]|nr:MAG: hypothetical protein KatS3mg005_3493 [Bryobacteraceae bacterium]